MFGTEGKKRKGFEVTLDRRSLFSFGRVGRNETMLFFEIKDKSVLIWHLCGWRETSHAHPVRVVFLVSQIDVLMIFVLCYFSIQCLMLRRWCERRQALKLRWTAESFFLVLWVGIAIWWFSRWQASVFWARICASGVRPVTWDQWDGFALVVFSEEASESLLFWVIRSEGVVHEVS